MDFQYIKKGFRNDSFVCFEGLSQCFSLFLHFPVLSVAGTDPNHRIPSSKESQLRGCIFAEKAYLVQSSRLTKNSSFYPSPVPVTSHGPDWNYEN